MSFNDSLKTVMSINVGQEMNPTIMRLAEPFLWLSVNNKKQSVKKCFNRNEILVHNSSCKKWACKYVKGPWENTTFCCHKNEKHTFVPKSAAIGNKKRILVKELGCV